MATVQFSRVVREGRGPRTARWLAEGARSLKAQQHARLKRDGVSTEPVGSSLAEPGSVDVLGRSGVAAGHHVVLLTKSCTGAGRRVSKRAPLKELPRKEVIQPHLPVRLPCYDFTPVTGPTFDGSLLAVRPPASGVTHSRGVTGGVYKARERIHRGNADPRLLATPPSCRRVSAYNPNRDAL